MPSTKWPTNSSVDVRGVIRSHIQSGIETRQRVLDSLVPAIEKASALVVGAVAAGRQVLFFGNGGSASDAQHLAAEFVGRYEKERRALAALALTTDTSILTAVANDYSFERIFSRQIEALGRPGDVAVGLSTSGRSPNVIAGLDTARQKGLATIALTGKDGGKLKSKADVTLIVPSDATSRIQECHIMIGHILCDLVDRSLNV